MNTKRLIVSWIVVGFLAVGASGCALIGAAASAGIGYAIYQATNK